MLLTKSYYKKAYLAKDNCLIDEFLDFFDQIDKSNYLFPITFYIIFGYFLRKV